MEIKIVNIADLKPNPDNTNQHPAEQIERLGEILRYQGFRNPLVVSNQSGFIVSGHGRLEAAKAIGMTEVPVYFQDFESYDQEFAHMNADNSIAAWANIDLKSVHAYDFGDGFDFNMLGFKDFKIDSEEVELPELSGKDPDIQQVTFILSNEQKDILDEAMAKAKLEEDCEDEINKNSNGNILSAIMRSYVGQ